MVTINYKTAIVRGKTVDFLLGNNEYHYPDVEWHPDLHISGYTFMSIREFGKEYGENKMMIQFIF